MSYTPGTKPKNFAEYVECAIDELIVRRLIPRKELGIETSGLYKTKKTVYQAFCNDCGYQINELDKPNNTYILEKNCAYEQICMSEDNILFNGLYQTVGNDINMLLIPGLNTLATKFDGTLQEAIEKYEPARIVAHRLSYKNIETMLPKDEFVFIDIGTYYLFPEITPDIAEFVVWKDVYEDPTPRYIGNGKSVCDIYEWINIVIHKPEKFIKVTIVSE
jgi:hypothetical protein